jgi:hypothetical protein
MRAIVFCRASRRLPLREDHHDVGLRDPRGRRRRRRARRWTSRPSCGPRARRRAALPGCRCEALLVQDLEHQRRMRAPRWPRSSMRRSAWHRPSAVMRLLSPASHAASSSTPRTQIDAMQMQALAASSGWTPVPRCPGAGSSPDCCSSRSCARRARGSSSSCRWPRALPSSRRGWTARGRVRRRRTDEAVAHVNAGERLETALFDGVEYAEQDGHLDGAGRVEPAIAVHAPGGAVLEVVCRYGDGACARLLADPADRVAQRCFLHRFPG